MFLKASGGSGGDQDFKDGSALVQELRLLGSSASYVAAEGLEALKSAAADGVAMAAPLAQAVKASAADAWFSVTNVVANLSSKAAAVFAASPAGSSVAGAGVAEL